MQDRHRAFLSGRARSLRSSAVAALAAGAALLTACSDDATGPDVANIEAAYGVVVESDGPVLGVSVQGRILRDGPDGDWCLADLDGTEGDCWPVDQRVQPGTVRWSPDGSKVAFDGRAERVSGLDADVSVLDLDTGEVITLADDGGDDPAGPQDVLPAWVDDDEVAFLRDRGGPLELVTAEARGLDGDVETVNIPSLALVNVVSQNAAVLDEDYAIALGPRPAELVRIDDDGVVRAVVEVAERGAEIGGTSRDTERAVVTSGIAGDELTPLLHVDGDGSTEASITASPATVSPDGRVVAAVVTDERGVTLWDPDGGEPRRLEPGQAATDWPVHGIVWTDDDRLVVWSPDAWQVVTLSEPD